ncbi:ATP-binding protein [Nocardioides terrisoli]|uniref:ATP-binding protein n=1 Tax=Nocardioides terrisoli TaxID=3388267 RepID=UPI00287B5C9A|nr:ATP-binding protein [Nocardioides marmorisolisilvae]
MNVAELHLPAESAYVAVLRMTTAGLAARVDFTLDDIEEVRMAVGEACALVLPGAREDGVLRARFELGAGTIKVTVSADTDDSEGPDLDSFGWQVLAALVDDLAAGHRSGAHYVSFAVTSETA